MVFGGHVMSAQGKYGADSAECIKYLSYYKEYYKSKNYDSALPNWRKAYSLCPPTANQTMLVDDSCQEIDCKECSQCRVPQCSH